MFLIRPPLASSGREFHPFTHAEMAAKLGASSGGAEMAIPGAAFSSVIFLISVACLYAISSTRYGSYAFNDVSDVATLIETSKACA